MALLSAQSLAGPGYIILNIMRALNIVALMSVVTASVVMLVKTFILSKFFFFDAVCHVIEAVIGMFLIVSECSLFRNYFARNWPLLSPAHGFVALGLAMMALGLNMLGNMNKEATSQKSLGLPFWRLLVASGILAVVIGFFNIVASYVFCDYSRNVTARRVRSHGAVAISEAGDLESVDSKLKPFSITTHHTGSSRSNHSNRSNTTQLPQQSFSPMKEPETSRFSFANWSPARTLRNARQSILPSYHSRAFGHSRSSSVYSRSVSGEKKGKKKNNRRSSIPDVPLQISAPLNVNPQFAHLCKPDLAHHPSHRRGEGESPATAAGGSGTGMAF